MSPLTHSHQLRTKIRLVRARLDEATYKLWNHPRLVDIYPEYLFQNHTVTRASVPLMEAALSCARTNFASDPVAVGTANYLAKHIPEERGHDHWLIEDMRQMGIDPSPVLKRMPSPAAATLVGAQYYWINHFHPVCLLGYIGVLEGTPPTVQYFERVVARSNLPKQALSSLFRHAKLDPQHRADLDEAIDGLPLTSEHSEMLGVSALQTVHLLTRVIEELTMSKLAKRKAAAARTDL
jgi:Iron-containing redox enzyme